MPASLGGAVRALATERGATPFMALFALFAALLGTLSGRDDVVVGTDVAGRDRLETEDLIGFFINQLPLRISLAGRPRLSELIDRARQSALDVYAHQELPFEKLVQALRPERSSAHAPIFQVKLNLQNLPALRHELPGLAFSQVPFERNVAELDLTLNLIDGPGGLFASAEFSRDLFDKARIADVLEGYEAVLALAADRPDSTLDDVAARLAELDCGRRAARDATLGAARERTFRNVRRTPIAGGTGQ
jgi:non-ribosomal peptide synthetase component F